MRIKGGHISSAKKRRGKFAGWAQSALALAMALFFVAQGPAVRAHGAHQDRDAAFGQTCERSGVIDLGSESRSPRTKVALDCEACLACAFASIANARIGFVVPSVVASRIVDRLPDVADAFPSPRRVTHSARAPPLFS
jgi:hypothetical protein